MTLIQDRQFGDALRVFDEILGVSDDTWDYLWRAKLHLAVGNYADALRDYDVVLERVPNDHSALHHAAVIQAACPDDDLRDGPESLRKASQALDQSKPDDWRTLSVIAAAHAECGDFERAADVARQVLELAPSDHRPRFLLRFQQYQRHEPFRISAEYVQAEMKVELACAKCGAPTFFSIQDASGGRIYACIKCAEYDAETAPTSEDRSD